MYASCSLFFILPQTIMATVRPPKRRRTGHQLPPMVEGSDMSVDTAMYIHSVGGERILVPVRPDVPAQTRVESNPEPEPDPESIDEFQQPDFDLHITPPRNRWFYMKEFVARVDGILQAMQAREALPNSTSCAECSESVAQWRCDDCIGGKLLCRFCMRHSHFSNPFHGINYSHSADSAPNPELEAARDEAAMRVLDQLLAGHNPEEITEEHDDSDVVDTEADVQDMDAGTAGFTNYMNERLGPDPGLQTHSIPNAPNCDALNNQYIRVVHTNGIHHIALVICTCQGHENITTDLIFAGWVPTSFVRIRTIFTTAVLDHFRYCNLEMRSSAYEFFQLL